MKMHIRPLLFLGTILTIALFAVPPTPARAFLGLSIGIAPPPLPVYAQPVCPGSGYIWTPGYWAWDAWDSDYYWVPGTWVLAPEVGYLWTPGWWGCDDGGYFFHTGYWGPNVGFYGGIAYGYGYNGRGYDGGYWRNRHFLYNRNFNNVSNLRGADVYSRAGTTHGSRVSYNGGAGGTTARPTAAETAAGRDHHIKATSQQVAHVRAASDNPGLRYANNHGHPSVLATPRPGEIPHTATASAPTGASHRTSTEGAFTGESHEASTGHEGAATGEEHRSVASEKSHAAASESHAFPSYSHPAAKAKPFSMGSHAPVSHAASHAPAAHAAAHASASHEEHRQ